MLNDKICAATLDGSLTNYKNYLAGYYRGFYTAVIPRGQFIYVTVNAESPLDPNNDRLRSTVAQEASGNKWLNQASSVGAYKVLLVIVAPGFASGLSKRVNAIVEPFVNDLAANGYVSGCGVCGRTDVTPELFDVNGMPAYYCPDCIERTRQHLEEGREAAQSVNSNLAIGMIGALIGTLAGVAAWVGIFMLGYISGLAGLLMAFLTLFLYEKFAGCIDKKGVIFCVILLVFGVFLGNHLAYTILIFRELKEYDYTFGECFRYMFQILNEDGIRGYVGDLLLGYVFTAICALPRIIAAFKQTSGSYSVKKVQ